MRASDQLPDRFNAAFHHVGRHVAEGRGDRTAIVVEGEHLTYAALDDRVRRAAAALREAGLHPGDRVALVLPDSPLLSVAFWGTIAAGSVAVPGYDLRIVDDAGQDAPYGQIGDLIVRGDSTMALYWNKHEATKRTLQGEWIRTGDKYLRDEQGFFWHAGRSDDMLKVGGIWVSPVEIEAALIGHPAVLECAVVGREDGDGLVKPHAFVVLRDDADAAGMEAGLQGYCRERLAKYKYPRWISFLPELPKTATGKIKRFLLRGDVARPTGA